MLNRMSVPDYFGMFHLKSSNIQFWISILVGWFLCGKLWYLSGNDVANKRDGLLTSLCPPCRDVECPKCEGEDTMSRHARNTNIENSYFRKYLYKAQSSNEDILSRWRYETVKHVYEMINQEPRIGLNGMWNLERQQVEKYSLEHMRNHKDGSNVKFKGMLRRTDPFYGTSYHVKLNFADSSIPDVTISGLLQIQRGFSGYKPKLLDITLVDDMERITIISPISKVSDRFHLFMKRFEERVLQNSGDGSGNVKLLFVIFTAGNSAENDESTKELLEVLKDFKVKNPRANIEQTFTTGEFNRARGLHIGVEKCEDNDLMLFLDVDLNISNEFFNRIRRNTIQHKTVMFPVTFSQYDPLVIKEAAENGAIPSHVYSDKMSVSEQTGFWIHYAFGIASMYKSDYMKVGGFKLDITGWGGEDVDLYKKFIANPDVEVFAAVDKDLIHIYHSRGCDRNLAHDQYVMCVGSWSETLGSQIEVASLYLLANKEMLKGSS